MSSSTIERRCPVSQLVAWLAKQIPDCLPSDLHFYCSLTILFGVVKNMVWTTWDSEKAETVEEPAQAASLPASKDADDKKAAPVKKRLPKI